MFGNNSKDIKCVRLPKASIVFFLNRRALDWLPFDLGLCLVGCGRQVRKNVRLLDKMLNIQIIFFNLVLNVLHVSCFGYIS